MTPIFNPFQQILSLSTFSNLAGGRTGSQEVLQQFLTQALTESLTGPQTVSLIGQWETVWGPVVYQADGSEVADNAMFVAKSSDASKYIISIAGTNPISWYGWFVEDFFVSKTIPWPYAEPSDLKPEISAGTTIGLDILTNKMKSNGKSIFDFLGELMGNRNQSVEIAVTGISLGGALSGTLALALRDTRHLWDANRFSTLTAYPVAGPTAGNADFARYTDDVMGGRIHRIWNVLDIVPHAWQEDMLRFAPYIYYPHIKPMLLVKLMTDLALFNGRNGNYAQIQPFAPGFPGLFNLSIAEISEQSGFAAEIQNLLTFLGQAAYQHTTAYFQMAGIMALFQVEALAPLKQVFPQGAESPKQEMIDFAEQLANRNK